MLRRINKALPELMLGIILYGFVLQISFVWFFDDKIRYSTGLWIGILLALGMAVHLAVVIEDAVSLGSSTRMLVLKSTLRYVVVVIVFLVLFYFKLGNPIMAFAGVFGLKVSAYLQPQLLALMLRVSRKSSITQE